MIQQIQIYFRNLPNLDSFIGHVHDMFDYSAMLQTLSAENEANNNSEIWQKFSTAAFGALKFLEDHFGNMENLEGVEDGLVKLLAENFNEDEVVKIANDLIIAAADTTSYTMLWTMYLMANHGARYQSCDKINWKNIFRESMRLYPVAPFLTRIQQKDLDTQHGYTIKKGQIVLISIYAMGRNDSNFSNADNFIPERWERSQDGKLKGVSNSFASLPFGFGSRSCIGKKMAEQQMEYFLEQFFKRFTLTTTTNQEQQVEMAMKLIGMPNKKIVFKITRK